MKSFISAAGLLSLAAALVVPQMPLDVAPLVDSMRIPNSSESAVMGRRILALSKLATFSTVYPSASPHVADRIDDLEEAAARPVRHPGVPVSLMEYVADCEDTGNPTILAITIGTSFRNVRAGSNITLSMRWTPPYPPAKRIPTLSSPFAQENVKSLSGRDAEAAEPPDTVPYSATNLPRFSLFGRLEPISATELKARDIPQCYVHKHPDAKLWLPGNKVHNSEWMRFVVTDVYWIGGFGDRAYIGWISADEWHSVTRKQWESIELQGEKKGWSEWSNSDL